MEVDRGTFMAMLPTLLNHISRAHFIAFDLELSGIPVHQRGKQSHRQSVEERFAELKTAAEQFQILQVGLTCVEECEDRYLLRSFNFNISPLVYEDLDLERTFTYSSGAVDFLLKNGYNMAAPFYGVPYLKDDEVELVKERARLKWDRQAIPDISIRAEDVLSQEFVKRVKREIEEWLRTRKPDVGFYNLTGRVVGGVIAPLSRFERRLIHQIVRADYPELTTWSGQNFVQVKEKRHEESAYAKEALDRRVSSAVTVQRGFAWIAKALAGEDLGELDINTCARKINGEPSYTTLESFTERMNELRAALRKKQTVLVGHNCFLDLVFLYGIFYGPLPATLGQFQDDVRRKFPLVLDTKFLATSGEDEMLFRSAQLYQIENSLMGRTTPVIDVERLYDDERFHEAGYDSLVTAKVFLRLACKLAEEESRTSNNESAVTGKHTQEEPEAPGTVVAEKSKRRSRKRSNTQENIKHVKGRFSHRNLFDKLEHVSDDDWQEETPDKELAENIQKMALSTHEHIPPWTSAFWDKFGNKLRVYGTIEESCDLGAKPKAVATANASSWWGSLETVLRGLAS